MEGPPLGEQSSGARHKLEGSPGNGERRVCFKGITISICAATCRNISKALIPQWTQSESPFQIQSSPRDSR